jgi:hypothetical protein
MCVVLVGGIGRHSRLDDAEKVLGLVGLYLFSLQYLDSRSLLSALSLAVARASPRASARARARPPPNPRLSLSQVPCALRAEL